MPLVYRAKPVELAYALGVCCIAAELLQEIISGKIDPDTVIRLANELHDLDLRLVGGSIEDRTESRIAAYNKRIDEMLETPLCDEPTGSIMCDDDGELVVAS